MSDNEFSKGDIVWGKIRGHPWWPAQITKIIKKRGRSMKHAKYKCAYINDSTHSELCSNSMKPFREYYTELSKRKIKQKSLKDAIKIAEQKDQDRRKGTQHFGYTTATFGEIQGFLDLDPSLEQNLTGFKNS